jgi:putative transposase
MKKTRYWEDQMVKILREAEQAPVSEVAKKHGISDVSPFSFLYPRSRTPPRRRS